MDVKSFVVNSFKVISNVLEDPFPIRLLCDSFALPNQECLNITNRADGTILLDPRPSKAGNSI